MGSGVGLAFRHRRAAGRLTLLAATLALLTFVPGAVAFDPLLDAGALDTTAVIDATATDTPAPGELTTFLDTPVTDPLAPVDTPPPVEPTPPIVAAPIVIVPPVDPVPVAPVDPVAIDPAAPVTPTPDPTPVATPNVIDAAPVTGGETNIISVTGSDTVVVTARPEVVETSPPVTTVTPMPARTTEAPSVITPLVVPIVQTLGPGLLSPYVAPETFGAQPPTHAAAGPRTRAPVDGPATPAQASPVSFDLFGVALPTGGWSGQSAGMLALLMGLLPLGLPDGKFSLGGQTQIAVLLMGALLMLVPFFASFLRDDRRRGPRGFAALALRPG